MESVAVYAAILSTTTLAWQVSIELRRRKAHVRVAWETEGRSLVIRVINAGDVTEHLRYVAFERRLRFGESALANGSRLNLALAGASKDGDRAKAQRVFGEALSVDVGVTQEFDPPIGIPPRSDWSWTIPLSELKGRDWSHGCVAKARLATDREFAHPGTWLTTKFYSYLLRNTLAGIPEEDHGTDLPSS